jgi:histidinol-phosphatase (PHP family)
MAVELNTSGIDKPLGRPYLSQELLNYAVEIGVPVCYGSDAHAPACMGGHFDVARKMFETAGCESPVTFVNRQAIQWDIP